MAPNSSVPRRIGQTRFMALALGVAGLLAGGVVEAQKPARWVSGELLVGFRAGVGPSGRHAFFRKHGACLRR